MLSYWTTFVALLVLMAISMFVEGGAPISGWTRLSSVKRIGQIAKIALLAPAKRSGSSASACSAWPPLLTALNFITTTLNLRAEGMSLVNAADGVGVVHGLQVALLAFPVLLGGAILLLLDRLAGTSFFLASGMVVSGKIIARSGGSPILWQHLFWFFRTSRGLHPSSFRAWASRRIFFPLSRAQASLRL